MQLEKSTSQLLNKEERRGKSTSVRKQKQRSSSGNGGTWMSRRVRGGKIKGKDESVGARSARLTCISTFYESKAEMFNLFDGSP